MLIQLILITFLLLLAIFVVLQRTVSLGMRLVVLLMLAAGAFLVWRPQDANALARMLDVGRGADLLLYLWIVISLSMMLLLYLKIVELHRMVTELARQHALSRPLRPAGSVAGTDSGPGRASETGVPRDRSDGAPSEWARSPP